MAARRASEGGACNRKVHSVSTSGLYHNNGISQSLASHQGLIA